MCMCVFFFCWGGGGGGGGHSKVLHPSNFRHIVLVAEFGEACYASCVCGFGVHSQGIGHNFVGTSNKQFGKG